MAITPPNPDQFDERLMFKAVRLARRGVGRVAPNPPVGCVIVDGSSGRVLGEGYHTRFGALHAEAEALANCYLRGNDARGATAYITLEPCNHFGKTPPCSRALIDAGIKRVVIGRDDPSDNAGGGARALRAAGIDVALLETEETHRLTNPFVKRVTTGYPYVIAKWAQTIDGRIATRSGLSQWISNERSRAAVHRLRARMDAIVTGVGTVITDDPMLTARDVAVVRRVARRVVIDEGLNTPVGARLITTARGAAAPTLIATTRDACNAKPDIMKHMTDAGVGVIAFDASSQTELADAALRYLVETFDATNVLVEAGGGLVGAMLHRETLIDELLIYLAPRLLADENARGPARMRMSEKIAGVRPLRLHKTRRLGDDVELRYLLY